MVCLANQDYETFDRVGKTLPVEDLKESRHQTHLPPWFDRKRFTEAKLITLHQSGKSNDLVTIFYRYWHTILHVKSWYEGDLTNPNDPAYQSLIMVREMHDNVARKQNRGKVARVDQLAISQRDMVLTQFAFVGLPILQPSMMGYSEDRAELEKLIYFWRVVGHLLGIRDEYNLCSGEYRVVREACQSVVRGHFQPGLEQMEDKCQGMAQSIVLASGQFVFLLYYNSLLKYLLEVIKIDSNHLCLTPIEQFSYHVMKLFMSKLSHYYFITVILNNLLRFSFYKLRWKFILRSIVHRLNKMNYDQQ